MQHGADAGAQKFTRANQGNFMIFGLWRKKNDNQAIIERQYAALTEAGRQPHFYRMGWVPDTVMGRFELISIMLILYFRRTRSSAQSGQEIAQSIIDAFFEDLDHSFRELGVGDLSIPKRMKKFAGMFYGRLQSYAAALDEKNEADLAEALARNLHPQASPVPEMTGLARYMLQADQTLRDIPEAVIETGSLAMPAPVAAEPERT